MNSTAVASVESLELPADGHFAWDVRWQGLKALRAFFSQCGRELEDRKNVPQRLKPGIAVILMARLKPCPSSMTAFPRKVQIHYANRGLKPYIFSLAYGPTKVVS